jgi:sterol desaturase/sphingolipid hydroxylase (fatty acid hydroxylase superfamily)
MRGPVEVITDLLLDQGTTLVIYIGAMLFAFAVLRWFPSSRARQDQKFWTHDMKVDLLFSLASGPILFAGLDLIDEHWIAPYINASPLLTSYKATTTGLPLVLQFALAFFVKEFFGYWRHRAMHWGPLWKFHSIHHSGEYVDYTTTFRFHPGELLGSWMVAILTVIIFPVSPISAGILFTASGIQQLLIHSNLRWTYGRFGWIFNSPAAHRWHHHPELGKGHNYAITLSLFDYMFGSFYLPPGECPTVAGINHPAPKSFWGLLKYPFEGEKELVSASEMKVEQHL